MIFQKYRLSNLIIKEWDTAGIKFDERSAVRRLYKINTITRNAAEADLIIKKIGGIYFSVSEWIERQAIDHAFIFNSLKTLADDLDFYHSKDLIHGDIKYSNIIVCKGVINLIDWEPILEYSVDGKIFYRSTMPYISAVDMLNRKITPRTDKIAYYYLCRRLLSECGRPERTSVIEIEKKIVNLKCTQIINNLHALSV